MNGRNFCAKALARRGIPITVILLGLTLSGFSAELRKSKPAPADLPSVVKGEKAGIEVGQYAPDFTLEPVQIYPDFKKWLGDKAPKSFKDKIMLSDLVGKKEVMLLFGSYT